MIVTGDTLLKKVISKRGKNMKTTVTKTTHSNVIVLKDPADIESNTELVKVMASAQALSDVEQPKLIELGTKHNTDQIQTDIELQPSESLFGEVPKIKITHHQIQNELSLSEVQSTSTGAVNVNPQNNVKKPVDDTSSHGLPEFFKVKSVLSLKKNKVVPKKRKYQVTAFVVEPNKVEKNKKRSDKTQEQLENITDSSGFFVKTPKTCETKSPYNTDIVDSDENSTDSDDDVGKFRCSKCKKLCKSKGSLLGHICNTCGKTASHSNTKNIVETNNEFSKVSDSYKGESSYNTDNVDTDDNTTEFDDDVEKLRCTKCKKLFKSKGSLLGHKRNICGKTASHLCPFCPYKAKSPVSVRVHVGRNHSIWPRLTKDNHWVY